MRAGNQFVFAPTAGHSGRSIAWPGKLVADWLQPLYPTVDLACATDTAVPIISFYRAKMVMGPNTFIVSGHRTHHGPLLSFPAVSIPFRQGNSSAGHDLQYQMG